MGKGTRTSSDGQQFKFLKPIDYYTKLSKNEVVDRYKEVSGIFNKVKNRVDGKPWIMTRSNYGVLGKQNMEMLGEGAFVAFRLSQQNAVQKKETTVTQERCFALLKKMLGLLVKNEKTRY